MLEVPFPLRTDRTGRYGIRRVAQANHHSKSPRSLTVARNVSCAAGPGGRGSPVLFMVTITSSLSLRRVYKHESFPCKRGCHSCGVRRFVFHLATFNAIAFRYPAPSPGGDLVN